MKRRSRSTGWFGIGFLVVFSSFVVTSLASTEPISAQEAGITFRVTAPDGVVSASGGLVPIEIVVGSPRAIQGVVIVDLSQRGGAIYRVPIDVAAGTVVTVPLAVPVSFGELVLDASLIVDGEIVAEASLRRFGGGGQIGIIAAVLGVEAPAGRVPLQVGSGSAQVLEVSASDLLSVGLPAVSTLIVSPEALVQLDGAAGDVVLGWAAGGGDLVVAGDPGSIDTFLPVEWRSANNDATAQPLGVGIVRYAGADWVNSVFPSGTAVSDPFGGPGAGVVGEVGQDPLSDLAADAGLRLPGVATVGWLLVGYVILAGPVMYLVLRRAKRTNLAWVALPALAAVFSVTALVIGSDLRSDRGNAHVTIIEVWPSGSRATTTALFTSSRGGDRRVDLPAGWSYLGGGSRFGPSGSGTTVSPGRGGTRVSFDLATGGTASGKFTGPVPSLDSALAITDVRLQSRTVSGTVTNNSTANLEEVLVLFGTAAADIDDLSAGESVDFSLEYSDRFVGQAREFALWPGMQFGRFGPQTEPDAVVGSAVWADWRTSDGWNTLRPAVVGVVGWTRDLDSPVAGITNGRTALFARATVLPDSAAGAPVPVAVVNDPESSTIQEANFFGRTWVTRVDVPASVAVEMLEVTATSIVSGLEFWVDGEWRPVELRGDRNVVIQPPNEALVDNTVWVRSSVAEWQFPGRPSVSVAIGSQGELVMLLEPGDLSLRLSAPQDFEDFDAVGVLGQSIDIEVEAGTSLGFFGDLVGPEWDEYNLTLVSGDTVTLLLSATHDSLLRVRNPDGRQVAENDDAGDCCNSGLTFTANTDGVFVIEARELGGFGQGEYELIIERIGGS